MTRQFVLLTSLLALGLAGALFLHAQPDPLDLMRLDTSLRQLSAPDTASPAATALVQQLISQLSAISEQGRVPSRITLERFTAELSRGLEGRNLADNQAIALRESIVSALRGNFATFVAATNLQETLLAANVEPQRAKTIAQLLAAIGEEVRGPDDLGLLPVIVVK